MTHRFFENTETYVAAVLAGDHIDCGAGATDGDHPTWLMEHLSKDGETLCMVKLACLMSSHVTTFEQAQNLKAYIDRLFMSIFTFNVENGGADESGITIDEIERIETLI